MTSVSPQTYEKHVVLVLFSTITHLPKTRWTIMIGENVDIVNEFFFKPCTDFLYIIYPRKWSYYQIDLSLRNVVAVGLSLITHCNLALFEVLHTWVSDAHCCHSEVLSTRRAQLNVVAIIVMNSGLGQHGVVLNLALPTGTKHIREYEQETYT